MYALASLNPGCALPSPFASFSSDVLGNPIRPLWAQANYVCLSSNPFFVLCGTRTSPDICILVVDAFAMPSSYRVCEHYRTWHVICYGKGKLIGC